MDRSSTLAAIGRDFMTVPTGTDCRAHNRRNLTGRMPVGRAGSGIL